MYRDEEVISLPKLSFELFIYLIHHAGKIGTVQEISSAVWKNAVVSNEAIIQRITILRKALSDDHKNPKHIESVRGRGYRLIPEPRFKTKSKNIRILRAVLFVLLLSAVMTSYWLKKSTVLPSTPIAEFSAITSEKAGNLASPLLERGRYYFNIGENKNIDRAIALFDEVLRDAPTNKGALIGLSLALSKSVWRYDQPLSVAYRATQLAEPVIAAGTKNNQASFTQ